ncbi:hypothetical protein RO07_01965 [Pandoraea pulmonicola]|nr:hypothetical protein RO07_01965 [Pandoraea pulmonicola]
MDLDIEHGAQGLTLVSETARTAAPNSVWWMFLLPYNFIEDFFIISHVSKSLERESRTHPALAGLRSFGRASGWGWCSAQVISLIPTVLGSWAGGLALVLWLWHWGFIRRIKRRLVSART